MDVKNWSAKTEIIVAVVKIGILSAATWYTVKWLVNQMDPTKNQKQGMINKAKQQLQALGIDYDSLGEYEMMIASHLINPSEINVTWSDIAGLNEVIQELKETVILPTRRPELFSSSSLYQTPKGVLLHGPPGCGKTLMAKATAREAGMRFINLDVSILTDKYYGESQKLTSAVFSLAVKLQPCIIFIDEIDSFLRTRSSHDHEATAMMKAQFMSLWDGLLTDPNCTVILMGATNRPQDLDMAIIRRMPSVFRIRLPNTSQRFQILNLILDGEPIDCDVDITRLAQQSDGFSGSDLQEMCRYASTSRVRDYIRNNIPLNDGEDNFHDVLRPISMRDLSLSLHKLRESKIMYETENFE